MLRFSYRTTTSPLDPQPSKPSNPPSLNSEPSSVSSLAWSPSSERRFRESMQIRWISKSESTPPVETDSKSEPASEGVEHELTRFLPRWFFSLSLFCSNVSGAQRELLKYYASVSSNRWLMVKIFGVLIIFVSSVLVSSRLVSSHSLAFVSKSSPSSFPFSLLLQFLMFILVT